MHNRRILSLFLSRHLLDKVISEEIAGGGYKNTAGNYTDGSGTVSFPESN